MGLNVPGEEFPVVLRLDVTLPPHLVEEHVKVVLHCRLHLLLCPWCGHDLTLIPQETQRLPIELEYRELLFPA